ncbi:TetR family transcriptional regulator [Litorivivens lipolytica]|uniref:TetR family transcriptional regulator n=1 Tax=Litorivivens lipolytica TaxID=1524264 RepID=UPI001606F778
MGAKLTKGEKTRQRLMDAAERLFAERGWRNTSLRDIAAEADIREPGIYNHFSGKESLYHEVLIRALQPLADAISETLASDLSENDLVGLPAKLTELLSEHPSMPALFHQALSSSSDDMGQQVMEVWLQRLFAQGESLWRAVNSNDSGDRRRITLRMVLMFNAVTGYFLSQKVLDQAGLGHVLDKANLEEQQNLLSSVMRTFVRS